MCGKDRERQVHGHGEFFVAIAAAMAVAMAAAIVAMVACLRQKKATYLLRQLQQNEWLRRYATILQMCSVWMAPAGTLLEPNCLF